MNQESENRSMSISECVNLVLAVANIWATSITPFIRTGMGRDIPGFAGLCVLVWIPIYFVITEEPAILWLCPAFVFAQMCHRIAGRRSIAGGAIVHSHYNGWPWFAMRFGAKDESRAKQFIEPLLVAIVGVLAMGWKPHVGLYLLGGAAAMLIVNTAIEERDRRRAQDMQNGMIEGGLLKTRTQPRTRRFGHGSTAG